MNESSRKCITLRLDPFPLELGRDQIHLHFGVIFEITTGRRKKRILA